MNLVDSSGWIEFFCDGKNADHYAVPLQDSENLLVPTVVMYEVYKVILREKGERDAIIVQAYMQDGIIVEITPVLAVAAAKLSIAHALPMADSMILAAARAHDAVIWTQDAHFKNLDGIKWFKA